MAAATDFQEKLLKMMECSICLDKLNNAKMLNCTHSFCKTCLDKLLLFRPDGSGTITCPLRCADMTEINENKTTNDLQVPVQLRNLMDMLAEEDINDNPNRQFKCEGTSGCKKDLSYCCTFCYAKLCTICKGNHNHKDDEDHKIDIRFQPIKYESVDFNDVLPWCEEHRTFSTYACQEGLICMYCKARDHASHRNDKLETLSQQILTWIETQNANIGESENNLETIKSVTKGEIKLIRERLLTTLKRRKIECLKRYLDRLSEEENKLVETFDIQTSQYMKTYPTLQPRDHVDNIPQFQLFLDRDRIFENVRRIGSGEVTIPQMEISLSEGSFNELHPLGTIQGVLVSTISLHEQTAVSTVSSNIPDNELDNNTVITNTLIKDLQNMIQDLSGTKDAMLECVAKVEVLDLSKPNDDAMLERMKNAEILGSGKAVAKDDKGKDGSTKAVAKDDKGKDGPSRSRERGFSESDINRRLTHLKEKEAKSLNYVWGYMRKHEDELIEVVKRWPDILQKRGTLDETLLHFAVSEGRTRLMKNLLSLKLVDVNAQLHHSKSTPLHIAVAKNNLEVVQILLEYNPDVQRRNKAGHTPVTLARSNDSHEIVNLLESYRL